ncbi:hypothetical protein [Phenylobacterium sp. Root700]|uniref:hypothetical protein n=1 Tax=Phenylobacterium sp. Root700 TaxID=1736591 RepID=UPI0006FAA57E|nr:hypothetical protein [Phenylobacterium sp. Root700]KRB42056.1 hypothetical protein ASE02_04390 [Phenylobacterium sp. Root700]
MRAGQAPPQKRNTPITVTDDWPDAVPVTDHEARIIEAFFADVLDDLFGGVDGKSGVMRAIRCGTSKGCLGCGSANGSGSLADERQPLCR